MRPRGDRIAFGGPGIDPRWEHGDKMAVGTAYSADSKVWYTLWRGVLTEVYYPIIDHPQLRDLQFLVTDGETFFHEERRHLEPSIERLDPLAPAYRVRTADPAGRYAIHKEVLSDPHLPVVLERVRLERIQPGPRPLQLYALAAPHLDAGGAMNNGFVAEISGRSILLAERGGIWLALGASLPFSQLSCGYVGASDGWTDLHDNLRMDWEFDRAPSGNIALTGRLPDDPPEFILALAFGRGPSFAVATLLQSLGFPFDRHKRRFLEQWARAMPAGSGAAHSTSDDGRLGRSSVMTLLTHQDKTFPGAFIASLAIPWGSVKNDADRGGYHLVWTRDLCEIATALLASGDTESPLHTLIYLAASQGEDGSFPQNFWLTGEPYWAAVQLDEVSFPILLAGQLKRRGALEAFDPYPVIRAAARFLVLAGPATGQERWEEASGYSPSTLAAHISALIVAAEFARERGEPDGARLLEEYADFLESHLEGWTVTHQGTLLPGVARHYVRILPVDPTDPVAPEELETAVLRVANAAPGAPDRFPAREIVDAGFLELVRYGLRPANDPLVVDSLRVVDALLRAETKRGPAWRRYNHHRYGPRDDGTAFVGWGVGRPWPLLTGERGHYELAAGREPRPYLHAMERFASESGLLPEQVWDGPDRPDWHLANGGPTGAAMPLAWAHAEYLKLLRSTVDGSVFDRVPAVARRYATGRSRAPPVEVWKLCRRPSEIPGDRTLRILAGRPFRLHWSTDDWASAIDTDAADGSLGLWYVDLWPTTGGAPQTVRFTFFWTDSRTWEGQDFAVRRLDRSDK